MKPVSRLLAVLGACCLLLAACQDKHEPVKPTVTPSLATLSA